jgi:hypothetical protein
MRYGITAKEETMNLAKTIWVGILMSALLLLAPEAIREVERAFAGTGIENSKLGDAMPLLAVEYDPVVPASFTQEMSIRAGATDL